MTRGDEMESRWADRAEEGGLRDETSILRPMVIWTRCVSIWGGDEGGLVQDGIGLGDGYE